MSQDTFAWRWQELNWDQEREAIYACTAKDVVAALTRAGRGSLADFRALISPAAAPYLEQMAALSQRLTRQRFGNAMQLYAPLYVSNACTNSCTYCGFSKEVRIKRTILDDTAIEADAKILAERGFQHVLLLTGEAEKRVGADYLANALDRLRPYFAQLSLEVQPLSVEEYRRMRRHGTTAVYLYQETYQASAYAAHHTAGRKADMPWRLDGPDRVGQAGMHKLGLGCLLGLADDWRTDCAFTFHHLRHLQKRYWRTRFSISFPRLRPHAGGLDPASPLGERELLQLLCAWRLVDGELELALSTRERAHFRDHACRLGVTAMSAGSTTNPGGYAQGEDASLEQFAIADERPAAAIAAMLRAQGLEPVWKDWDRAYDQPLRSA